MPEEKFKDLNLAITAASYNPDPDEKSVGTYLEKRIIAMKNYRKSLKVEDDWKEADEEYFPHELTFSTGKRFETDPELGLRSRLVPIGTERDDWRERDADASLLVKIHTALSVIIDKDPELALTAMNEKFKERSVLANALWKRNWELTKSKDVLKLFAFNLAKYGWAVGRTAPRIIKQQKSVMTSYNANDPAKNKYEDKELVLFNDVFRENMDPFRTWVDELTKPYDPLSMNDCYYELDYSYLGAQTEFGQYKNFEAVLPQGSTEEQVKQSASERRNDIVTIGFFESRNPDLTVFYVPKQKIVLHQCPLTNDEGKLSLWQAPWVLRDAKTPYGIGLWRIIKQNKTLFDKLKNMTMDQLTLSIFKMFFYTGVDPKFGDNAIKITPGLGKKLTNGSVTFMDVPGPGAEAWKGLEYIKSQIDDDSGIPPTIEGQITGKTLGEVQLARESALKRLRVPIENISSAIEQDAYVSLSWFAQIYSTPEIKDFATIEELTAYEQETGAKHVELFGDMNPETNQLDGKMKATFLPQLALHLENRDGQLFESQDSRFFNVHPQKGDNKITPSELKWEGVVRVVSKSLLSPSEELEKQRKLELFNMIAPLLSQPPELVKNAVVQIIKVNDEDPKDWLPESWIVQQNSLFVNNPMMQPQGQPGQPPSQGAPTGQPQSMQANQKLTPNQGAQTVVPGSALPNPTGMPMPQSA